MNVVCEMEIPFQSGGVTFYLANALGTDGGTTYFDFLGTCGDIPPGYATVDSLGFGDAQWIQSYTTWDSGGPVTCVGDLNEDGVVDGADLTILLGDWGGGAATAAA